MTPAGKYTCTEYRQEMILLGLKRQLEAPELPPGVFDALCQRINSRLWVPESSPREINGRSLA